MLLNGKTSALLFTLFRESSLTEPVELTRIRAIGARVVARAVVAAFSWRSQVWQRGVAKY